MAIVTKQQLVMDWDRYWSQERELWEESCRDSARSMVDWHGGAVIWIPNSDSGPIGAQVFKWLDRTVDPGTWSQFGPYWWFQNESDATVAALRWS